MGYLVLVHKPLLSSTLSKDTVTAERSSSAWQLGIMKNNEKRGLVPTMDIENKDNQNHMVGKYFSVTYHNHAEVRRPMHINVNTGKNEEHLKIRWDLTFTSVYNQSFL